MTPDEFNNKFPDEVSCRAHWKAQREKHGISCYKCGKTDMYWNKTNEQWRCKTCKSPTSLRKGTVMENTHLPFHLWYQALFLLCNGKKEISATKMQVELGHKFYEPIWYMMQKIRLSAGNGDNLEELSKFFEDDDVSVMGVILNKDINK